MGMLPTCVMSDLPEEVRFYAAGAFVSRSGAMQGSSTSTGNTDEVLPPVWRTGDVLSGTEGLTMGGDYGVC